MSSAAGNSDSWQGHRLLESTGQTASSPNWMRLVGCMCQVVKGMLDRQANQMISHA